MKNFKKNQITIKELKNTKGGILGLTPEERCEMRGAPFYWNGNRCVVDIGC